MNQTQAGCASLSRQRGSRPPHPVPIPGCVPCRRGRTDSETRIHVAPSTFLTSSLLPSAPMESSMARALEAELDASWPRYLAAAVASTSAALAFAPTLAPASINDAPADNNCAPSLGASGSDAGVAAPDAHEDAPAASVGVGSAGAGLVCTAASSCPWAYFSAAAVSSWAAVVAPAPTSPVAPSFPAVAPSLLGATSAEAPHPWTTIDTRSAHHDEPSFPAFPHLTSPT